MASLVSASVYEQQIWDLVCNLMKPDTLMMFKAMNPDDLYNECDLQSFER